MLPHLVANPIEQISMARVAALSGLSLWPLRRTFGTIEALYRVAFAHLANNAIAGAGTAPPAAATVVETVRQQVGYVSKVIGRPEYKDMLTLLIRNGLHFAWMADDYELKIVRPLASLLCKRVDEAAARHDLPVVLPEEDARFVIRRLEEAVVLPSFLPNQRPPSGDALHLLQDQLTRETFNATRAFALPASTGAWQLASRA